MAQLASRIVNEKLSGKMLNVQTGRLRDSIAVEKARETGSSIVAGVVGVSAPPHYGRLLDIPAVRGTGGVPHVWQIVATPRRALRFLNEGREVYAKSVFHPPLSMRQFMSSALSEDATRIKTALQQALDSELR